MIASLLRVAEEVGRTPTSADYRRLQPILSTAGEDLIPYSQLYKYFDGAWFRAVEAFELADVTTPKMIEARLRRRRVGKVNRYSDEVMRDALAQAVDFYGYPPSVDEYDAWRERELELARERGDNGLQIPSVQPYRRRWRDWIGALDHLGYDTSQVGAYRGPSPKPRQARRAGRQPTAGRTNARE